MSLLEHFKSCWLTAIIGCILFMCGTFVLFWNEGRAVQSHLVLDEAMNSVFSVNSELPIEQIYENGLVHLTGPVMMEEPLTEPDYNIQVLAVKLRRRVQMYQWVEETVQHNYGGVADSVETDDRTYYYVKEWKDKIIESRSFYIPTGHHNPTKFPLESKIHVADNVIIGHYEMGMDVKEKITGFIELTSDTRPEDSSIKLHSGLYYHCDDIWNPVIGDIRVQFSYSGLENEVYTVIGKLKEGKVVKYNTNHGRSLIILKKGTMSVEEAIKAEHQSERLTTWGFRFFGWVLLFFAATCTASLLFIFLSEYTHLSTLLPESSISVSTNLFLTFSLALCITSIAWIIHRPWIGAGLLFAATTPFLYCIRGVAQYQRLN